MPSIPRLGRSHKTTTMSFKPCYKWNAFNTTWKKSQTYTEDVVLNLVISGMPSILQA